MNPAEKHAIYRILDANFNRAREALRVIEEAARFRLDEPYLVECTKALRHRLTSAMGALESEWLLSARDTAGDVGTEITAEAEAKRDGIADILRAAFGRLAEALRALEEYAKPISPDAGRGFEAIRYEVYQLEKALEGAKRSKGRLGSVRLCVLLSEALCNRPVLEVARAAVAGGADCLQVREKNLPDRRLLEHAREVRRICRGAGALCIVNDRPDIALASGADGVHVGQDDEPVAAVRRLLGPEMTIGLSTHTLEQARDAVMQAADYIGIGPMFESTTKKIETIPGPQLLRDITAEIHIPHMAIGGITPQNVDEVIAAGAGCIAVASAVCSADDPEAAARVLKEKMEAAKNP